MFKKLATPSENVADRLDECLDFYERGLDFNCFSTCMTALDNTSKRRFPKLSKDNKRILCFLHNFEGLITLIAVGSWIQNNVSDEQTIAGTLFAARHDALHEAKISNFIEFGKDSVLSINTGGANQGQSYYKFPRTILLGLIISTLIAKENSEVRLKHTNIVKIKNILSPISLLAGQETFVSERLTQYFHNPAVFNFLPNGYEVSENGHVVKKPKVG